MKGKMMRVNPYFERLQARTGQCDVLDEVDTLAVRSTALAARVTMAVGAGPMIHGL